MKKENEISDNFLNLIKIVENLRDNEEGCLWCNSQTSETIAKYSLEEAEEVCNRAMIINNGEIIVDRPTEDLFDKYGRLTQTFREATTSINVMGELKSHA